MSGAQKIIFTIAIVGYIPLVTLFVVLYELSPHSAYELAQKNGCKHILTNGNCKITRNTFTGEALEVKPQDLPNYGIGSDYQFITSKQLVIAIIATTTFFVVLFTPLFFIWASKKKQ